jgi:chemotaxis response regulator CheB
MPREAIALGAAEKVLPLDRIAPALVAACAGYHQREEGSFVHR